MYPDKQPHGADQHGDPKVDQGRWELPRREIGTHACRGAAQTYCFDKMGKRDLPEHVEALRNVERGSPGYQGDKPKGYPLEVPLPSLYKNIKMCKD